ncbi:protein AATF-like [Ylistrum balloti]|uniref:protein AATF-like n=1 Tax=Ylistrum balloti TaxID=509963 RepID=UPI002905A740|nr:protein AATF-like [Ylistrum balloti]
MAALREAIALLSNPAPVFQDPEDNEDDTDAKVVSKSIEDEEDNAEASHVSSLRKKTALSTADLGEKYAGKKTSRKKLSQFGESDNEEESDDEDDEEFEDLEDHSDSESESENNDEDDEDEEDIKSFQNKISQVSQPSKSSFSFADDGDYSKYADMDQDEDESEGSDDESNENDEDDSEDIGDSEDAGDEDEDDMEESMNGNEEMTKFSKADVNLEIEKGKAAKAQLGIWDSLLENRIKLQKVVGLVNQLPQPDTWGTFEDNSEKGDNFTQTSLTAQASLQNLLDKLLQLQTVLLLQNTETRHIAMGTNSSAKSVKEARSEEDDEEITSESETEEAEDNIKSLIQKTGVKRKLTLDEYSETLTKKHKDFLGFRNTAIQKWYDRTRLVSGKVNSKSFSSFDQSALKQIEQILGDKERLIKRTQLKRSVFRVLGTVENADQEEITPDKQISTDLDNLKNYDPEIFDDSDFYHQQLRELIERKAADTDNPVALSRHWLEIQKLRKKVKKNVDTKASKGRKTRYEVHKKLINFMAPEDRCSWTDESRDDLYKSLFGKRFQQSSSAPDAESSSTVK